MERASVDGAEQGLFLWVNFINFYFFMSIIRFSNFYKLFNYAETTVQYLGRVLKLLRVENSSLMFGLTHGKFS